jgi:(R,R)-butanediol dehydrogenase/meso-butanediol dehydrogenase/diacetyl reductase
VLHEPGPIVLQELPRPAPRSGEVLVKVEACGICGSDLHRARAAKLPAAAPIGHEIVGTVVSNGRRQPDASRARSRVAIEATTACQHCQECRSGKPYLCEQYHLIVGGFADYIAVPRYAVHAVPPELSWTRAALAEPTAVAVHAVRIAAVHKYAQVLVIGGGTIGILLGLVLRARQDAPVAVVTRYEHQAAVAASLGLDVRTDATADGDAPPDVVFEAVGGGAEPLEQALDVVRPGGTVCVVGRYSGAVSVDMNKVVARELTLRGSATYGRRPSDFAAALAILTDAPDEIDALITHQFGLAAAAEAFSVAGTKSSGAIKVLITPGANGDEPSKEPVG